ncbi:substrate-binding protein domain-containing protein [Paracoccus tibetensis]|uniref:Substrate-binding protein domain-containing protein n=1 Tax=Paracoccus tibetensis TaxID=336292 RepID=A0A1G5B5J0_9RHOB|nr:substrate-binding protein domain-containing protein [Paracoccus tibetensis]
MAARHDAVILCIAHDDRLAAGLAGLVAAGRPVVTLATEIRCPGAIYVGPDNRQSGRVAGDMVGRLLGAAGGEVLVIAGHLSMLGHAERVAGFDEVLTARYPTCRVVARVESHDQADLAADLTWRELQRHPGIRAIYNAAVGASAVAAALAARGRAQEVVLVGHELTEDSRPLLASGAIDALIDQDPALEIQTAIAAIARRHGRVPDGPVVPFTPLRIVMRENC